MRNRLVSSVLTVLGLLAATSTADAQSGTITGRVTQAASGAPVGAASIQVRQGNTQVGSGQSGDDGTFRIANIPVGTHAVVVRSPGYSERRFEGVSVAAGAITTVNVSLSEIAAKLNPVSVTGTRGAEPEKILDSPNAISVVTSERIAERTAITVTDHIKGQPGLSVSQGGLVQSNVVSRGFNNAFSTTMLMLQDYRFAGVPSLRVNVPFLFTGTGEDIDRIELLQGPASALYGPNSGAGVLHVITKSPFTSKGTTLAMDGGQRSLARLAGRHAGTFGESKFGYKLSGEYFTAKDWQYHDPNETRLGPTATQAERDAYRVWSATDLRVPASRRGQPKVRNFDLERISGEARLDYRPNEDTEMITTVGRTQLGSALEITTTFGATQVKNWSYSNFQQRFRHKKFFAQVFYNVSDAGNDSPTDDGGTFYLRSGIPVVDQSSVLVGQLQQGFLLRDSKFTAGLDYIATRPKTAGTIMGRNEDDDSINELGGYLQVTHPLSEKVDFMGAVRGDMNSRIEGTQFSPRAAFLFKATPTQNFRLTYNRAFNSPASFAFFLDQFSGTRRLLGPALGNVDVQIFGNPPKKGWRYDRTCDPLINGGLCMRSPLAGPNPVAANGANLVPGVMAVNGLALANGAQTSFGLTNTQRDNIRNVLVGLRPTNAQVLGVLRNLGAAGTPIVPWTNPVDLAPLSAIFSNTYELGYKGVLGNKLRVAVDYWYQVRPADPTTQVINLRDAVFLDPATLGSYLGATMGPVLGANGVPGAAIGPTITAWVTSLAGLPGGMLNFSGVNNPNYDRTYLVFTYQAATGTVDVRGVDVALDYLLTDNWTIETTYSNLSKNVFAKAPGATALNPLSANTPKHRATLTFHYSNEGRGLSGEVRGRYMDAFNVNSGVYNNYNLSTAIPYDRVATSTMFDAGLSWRLPFAYNVRWSMNAQNIFNHYRASFIGVPVIGRFVSTRLQYSF